MIRTRDDYLRFLEADRRALGCGGRRDRFRHEIWRFQRQLRKAEFLRNSATGPLGRLRAKWAEWRLDRLGRTLGFTIPVNVFGPGLSIAHRGTIVVNEHARIGANCRIHVCVNIGASISDGRAAPRIGDHCYIGPGVKMYGGIELADDITIGANAVVNRSFTDPSITIAGVPARKIADVGTKANRPKA